MKIPLFFSSSQAGSYKVYAEHNGIKSNELTLKVEDKAAIAAKEAEDKRIAEEKATQEAAAQAESQERFLRIRKSFLKKTMIR